MKTFSIPWQGLLITAGLLYGAAGAAQIVRVPANVNVVVPGIGGIDGFGGEVGDGGIVCMPDPETQPGISEFSGGTVLSWSLLGDISFSNGITPPTPAIQSEGAVQQVKIMSYNKSVRPGYEESIVPYISRSKGEVTVLYQSGDCNDFITYEILKTWQQPNPKIVGPDCWQEAQTYVYAVDIASGDNVSDQIGFDKYYWQVVDANNTVFGTFANNSAESSSIVFTTPDSFLGLIRPFFLRCCYGQCNNTAPWPGPLENLGIDMNAANTMTSCVTKAIGTLPSASTIFPACIAIGATSQPTINITPLPDYLYTYSAPCAWILTPSSQTAQGEDLTISGIDNNPCTITQTMVGPCGTQVFTYVINRNFAPSQPILTLSSNCVLAGANFTVSFPSSALNNCATWVVRNSLNQVVNWSGTPGNGTNSVRTFTIPNGTTVGAYTVCATSCTCPGSSCITVNVRPTAPVITGPICVPSGNAGSQLYQCNSQNGVSTYTWTNTFLPAWVQSPLSTGITSNLLATGNNSGQVRVIANGTNGCVSALGSLLVNRTPTTPVVNQPLCFNIGYPTTNVVFTVSNPQTAGHTYTWNFPAIFSPTGVPTGTSVSRNLSGTSGTYTVTVTNANVCGSAPFSFVPLNTAAPTVFLADNGPMSNISTTAVTGATYRLWDCGGFTFVAGPQPSNVFPLNNPGNGNYAIEVTLSALSGGCRWLTPCTTTAHINFRPEDPPTFVQPPCDVLVSPNPSTGQIRVDLTGDAETASMLIFDLKGAAIGSPHRLNRGANSIDLSVLASGTYLLLVDVGGVVQTKEIVIAKE